MIVQNRITVDAPLGFHSLWPEEIRTSKELLRQIEARKELCTRLALFFREVPDVTTDIANAAATGSVDLENLSSLYTLLADFLNTDQSHARVVLYLPFEMLCDRTWRPRDEKLSRAVTRFFHAYMKRWNELLMDGNDVRANFVDGDILEEELQTQSPPLVKKAAHLIPILVGKGLLPVSEVVTMLYKSSDMVLRESIFDALPVLADLSLFPFAEWQRLLSSKDQRLRHATLSMARRLSQEDSPAPEDNALLQFADSGIREISVDVWLKKAAFRMTEELKAAESHGDSERDKKVPKARANWEQKVRRESVIAKYAGFFADALVSRVFSTETLFGFITSWNDPVLALTGIKGVGKAVEKTARRDLEEARKLQQESDPLFRTLPQRENADIRDTLLSVLARWIGLGVVDRSYLEELGMEIPKFDLSYCEDGTLVAEDEVEKLTPALLAMESDPEISRFFYPIVILFGSRVKGYATCEADLDLAVCVKPGVCFEERPRLQALLSQTFSEVVKSEGRMVEFWLAEEGSRLYVRDFATADSALADSTWAHVLFGGIWYGVKEAMREIYAGLLTGYLFFENKKREGRDARSVWLEEMEREVLQYRLMHYGYHRYHPERGGIRTKHSREIDPQSAFWDSGYRRLATMLFLRRVFLPQLTRV